MRFGDWKPYVPAAKRRAQAKKAPANATKSGQSLAPVAIEGRAIAKTFWGKAWCQNLESYSDFANRLPRGRTYVRNGSVIDLKVEPGKVRARVMGSSLYEIEIRIAAVPEQHWKVLTKECTGSIASLVELLQGRLSQSVMERICQPRTGLFPAPKDIGLKCSCPDSATMCKHIAAVLYGVGARLDQQPDLLFTLRKVDATHLVAQAAESPMQVMQTSNQSNVLDDAELTDIFGIEMVTASILQVKKKSEAVATPRGAAAVVSSVPSTATARKKVSKVQKRAKKNALKKNAPKKNAPKKNAASVKPLHAAAACKNAKPVAARKPRIR